MSIGTNEDILRFQVTINNTGRMKTINPFNLDMTLRMMLCLFDSSTTYYFCSIESGTIPTKSTPSG